MATTAMSAAPVILEGIVGSTAYGLATAHSDVDKLGIKLLPAKHFLGLEMPLDKTLSEVQTDPDVTYHDIGKFCRLALSCNPTVTELLWLPEDLYTVGGEVYSPGEWLIWNRKKFLSAKRVRESYMGYAKAQFTRLVERGDSFSSDTKNRTQKHARHLLRLMHQGYTLYTTGDLPIRLSDPEKYHEFGEQVAADPLVAKAQIEYYEAMFRGSSTVLPEEPDRNLINGYVTGLRWRNMEIGWDNEPTEPATPSVVTPMDCDTNSSMSVFDPRNPLGFRGL